MVQGKVINMNKWVRTYSRKRGEVTLIEGVEKLCRLCLKEAEDSVPIFFDKGGNVCAALALRIMMCVGFEVANEECLPNKICVECNKELEKIYMFRKKCEASFQRLKSHMAAVKKSIVNQTEKEVNPKIEESNEKGDERLDVNVEEEKNVNNVMFVVNSDGTIKFEQCIDKEGMCITEPNNETVNESNSLLLQNVENEKGIEQMQVIRKPEDCEKLITDSVKVETAVIEKKEASEPEDVMTVLSRLLIDAGVLTCHDKQFSVNFDQNVEIETADGNVVTLEFHEESEEEQTSNTMIEFNINNEISEKLPVIEHVMPKHQKVHNVKKPEGGWWCSECGLTLGSRSALARHALGVHARLRPHACPDCGRAFSQKSVLQRHMLIHQEKRPFQCSECSKSFTQRGALEQHGRVHRRTLALHHCPVCMKVFLYASGLSRHMITHNSRHFSCGGCQHQFNDKSSLRRHMKNTNHPPDPNT